MNSILYTTLNQELINDWQLLWQSSEYSSYVNSVQWFQSVVKSFSYEDFVIVAVYESSKLAAIGCLFKTNKYGVKVYSLAPNDFVYGTPFLLDFSNKELTSFFLKELARIGTIQIDNVSEDILPHFTSYKLSSATHTANNYYLGLTKNEQGITHIPKRKRLMREAKEIEGQISFKSFSGYSKEAFEIAYNIDQLSEKNDRGYNTFSNKAIRKFYQVLGEYFYKNFLVNILYINNVPVVYEMGFLIGGTYYGSQIAYDKSYKRYSPGKVLEVKLIEYLDSINAQTIDYGSGENLVKITLASGSRKLYKVIISKSPLIRYYLKIIYKVRETLFQYLSSNKELYSLYRNLSH